MRAWISVAALNGFLAVAMGAYASHGFGGEAGESARAWAETGTRYQMAHALALLAIAILARRTVGPTRRFYRLAAWAFLAGLVLFCGGLYVLAFGRPFDPGVLVPIGGFAFLVGWGALFVAGFYHARR